MSGMHESRPISGLMQRTVDAREAQPTRLLLRATGPCRCRSSVANAPALVAGSCCTAIAAAASVAPLPERQRQRHRLLDADSSAGPVAAIDQARDELRQAVAAGRGEGEGPVVGVLQQGGPRGVDAAIAADCDACNATGASEHCLWLEHVSCDAAHCHHHAPAHTLGGSPTRYSHAVRTGGPVRALCERRAALRRHRAPLYEHIPTPAAAARSSGPSLAAPACVARGRARGRCGRGRCRGPVVGEAEEGVLVGAVDARAEALRQPPPRRRARHPRVRPLHVGTRWMAAKAPSRTKQCARKRTRAARKRPGHTCIGPELLCTSVFCACAVPSVDPQPE